MCCGISCIMGCKCGKAGRETVSVCSMGWRRDELVFAQHGGHVVH